MNENFSEIVAKKETELKKEVVKQVNLQKKMDEIERKVDTSPLDQAHKDKVKQELGKLHDGHKSRLQGMEKTTEASLKSAVENIQKDLETFESRPEVAFLFQVINGPEFKEIEKQQQAIPALETKVKATADEYQSHLMANGELAPGHETKIEEYVMSINELYIGMGALVQQKESFAGSNPEHLQVLEKVLGKKNTITLANFKANPAVHAGVEASSSELKIPATSAELKNLQRITANNLLQVRSALYRSTGNPKYEEAYKQESEIIRQGLANQANTPLEAVSTTPENEAMKRHAQEKLTSVGAEFAAIQSARGKDPISAQRDAVTLLERLRGFTKGYKMGDADKDLQMIELKKFPEVEKAFQDGVEKYIGETENLILDATTNNPTMRAYQTEAMSVTEGTLPFIKSVETLFQQVQNGQGVPSENTMKMFHDNANGILLDPGFNKLASTDAYQFFGNLKIPDEAASPRLHEIMTKMQDAQQKVKDYIHSVNVVTRQVLGMQGHGVGPEAFFKDAAKFTAITVAAVAGAVAMGALIVAITAASGGALTGVALFAANTAATSLGAAIGSNYMTAAIEGNADAISTENMLTSWGQGALFSGAGAIAGQALGTALGKGAQQLSQTFNIAPGKILSAPSIKEGIRATGLKGYLQHVASETKEEIFEDAMQKIGEGLAPNEPWLGFVFSLIPSATGRARDILHKNGVERTVTDKGVEIIYDNPEIAADALERVNAPEEIVKSIRENQAVTIEQDGVEIKIEPKMDNAIEDEFSNLNIESLKRLLEEQNTSAKDIMIALKQEPELARLLEADAGVGDRISIEIHVERLDSQFEKFLTKRELPPGIDKNFFRILFALHDIGKPIAIQKGNKAMQHEETIPIMRNVLKKIGYDPVKTEVMIALVDGDPIGEAIRKKKFKDAASEIDTMARKAKMPIDQFYQILEIFYLSDASSYTSEAGGKGSLDEVFAFDREAGTVDFSSKSKFAVDQLKIELEKITKAREKGMIAEEEITAYIEEHKTTLEDEVRKLAEEDWEKRTEKIMEIMSKDKVKALAIMHQLNIHLDSLTKGTERESNLDNIEKYRTNESAIQGALKKIEAIRQKNGKDEQYGLMTIMYNENPALYVAAMERLTYDIDIETSRGNRDAKIAQLLEPYKTEREKRSIDLLQQRVEHEIVRALMDTHGTDLNAIFGMIQEGGIDTPHERKRQGKTTKNTSGDDLKLAGSLSVFSYLGSFWEINGKDVLITFDQEFVESKGINDSFYTTEDFLLKPVKDLDPDKEGVRMSFDEKLRDVMKRQDMKRYISYKIAEHIFREAIKNGVPVEEVPSMDLVNGFTSYIKEHSDIQKLGASKLGGRPEGHSKFEIPVDKMTIRLPKESVADLLADIQKQKAVFDKRINGDDPERALDRSQLRDYKMLQALEAKFKQALAINKNMSMRDLLLLHIEETKKEMEKRLEADKTDIVAEKILERLKKINPNQIKEYEKGGLNSDRDYKRREYIEQVLGVQLSDQLAMDQYKKFNIIETEEATHIYSEEENFLKDLEGHLIESGIGKDAMVRKKNVLIISGIEEKNIAQLTRDYMLIYSDKAKKSKVIAIQKPKGQIAINPTSIPDIVKILQTAKIDKTAMLEAKQAIISRGKESLSELREKYKLGDEIIMELNRIIESNSVTVAIEKKAA